MTEQGWLPRRVVELLTAAGQTVATAESLTAGLVCAALAEVPGSSAVLRGGLVVYATDLKHELAGVSASLLEAEGAVHPEVAAQLAAGTRERCRSDWGLGLTGVAGPAAQDGVSPGTVYVAVCGPEGRHARTLGISGDRDTVRTEAVRGVLALLSEQLG